MKTRWLRLISCPAKVFIALSMVQALSLEVHAESYDFRYTLKSAMQADAEKYLVEKQNFKAFQESFKPNCVYWGVVRNNEPARLTFRFKLKQPLESAMLNTNMLTSNFNNSEALGDGLGTGSLWCSADGKDWILLKEARMPVDRVVEHHFFINRLPERLKGSREIWLQVRMQASGMTDPDYSTAQFARNMHDMDVNMLVFDLRVKCAKPVSPDSSKKPTRVAGLPNP